IVDAAETLKIAEVPVFSVLKADHPAYTVLLSTAADTIFKNQPESSKVPLDIIKLRIEAYVKLATTLAEKSTTETGKVLSTTAFIAQFATLYGPTPSELLQAPHSLIRSMTDDPLAYRELLVDIPVGSRLDVLAQSSTSQLLARPLKMSPKRRRPSTVPELLSILVPWLAAVFVLLQKGNIVSILEYILRLCDLRRDTRFDSAVLAFDERFRRSLPGAVRRLAREQDIPLSLALDQVLSNPVDIKAWAIALRE
ncbi:hypothetical protein FOZ63_014936, partial [Perkinsus olseni]